MAFKNGDKVVSVRQVPGAGFAYWAPAVYEARERKSDGAVTWRCVSNPLGYIVNGRGMLVPVAFRSKSKAENAAEQFGTYVAGIRHGATVQQ